MRVAFLNKGIQFIQICVYFPKLFHSIFHKPMEISMKNSLLVIAIITLIFNVSCKKNTTSSTNTAPVATFTITPSSGGTTATVFAFDASNCTDNEDANSELQVRWDWENDGTYDTNYSTTKTANHQYSTVGTYTVKLEVNDNEGLIDTTNNIVTVYTGTVTDIDGNIYNTIQIGNQLWIAENLKVTHYNNGEPISNVIDGTEWINLSTDAYCSYDNSDNNIDTYGLLYNWYAVDDSRSLAPAGWHIPTDEEWKELEMYLGMSQSEADGNGLRGTDEGGKLKGTTYWNMPNTGATNESGFSALPGGVRSEGGRCYFMGSLATFWSTTESSSSNAWSRYLDRGDSEVSRDNGYKQLGFSVRCLSD